MQWNKIYLFLLLCPLTVTGQVNDTISQPVNKKGLRIATISSAVVYTASLAALNSVWYDDKGTQEFTFFNDNVEWKQVDKMGHFYSSFYLSYGISRGLQHYNVPLKKSDWVGAITGFAVLLPIEVFDGFSVAYGASVGDIVADGAGSMFYLAQKSLWNEVRIFPKFSFHSTKYSDLRPSLLGTGSERLLKDYNGQTYWLSVDMDKFMSFPKWLNLAVGYGAEGMIYARDSQQQQAGFDSAYRQYYFALDPDLSSIKTRSKALKTVFFILNMVKIPAPTLQFSKNGARFFPAYL